jgi:hypothetical protein
VAQSFWLGAGEVAFEQERFGPGEQVVGERDELEPHLVVGEAAERQVGEAGVFVAADVVLDACAGAVVALQFGDVAAPALPGRSRLASASPV